MMRSRSIFSGGTLSRSPARFVFPPEILALIPDFWNTHGRDQDIITLTHVSRAWEGGCLYHGLLCGPVSRSDEEKTHIYFEQRSKSFPTPDFARRNLHTRPGGLGRANGHDTFTRVDVEGFFSKGVVCIVSHHARLQQAHTRHPILPFMEPGRYGNVRNRSCCHSTEHKEGGEETHKVILFRCEEPISAHWISHNSGGNGMATYSVKLESTAP